MAEELDEGRTAPPDGGAIPGDLIASRLRGVREQIDRAANAAGRPAGAVRLLAVSKGQPASALRAAYAAGQRDFGENYVQELERKADALHDLSDLRFHFIGQLQRNKAKQVVQVAKTIHSVDRAELAVELDRRAASAGVTLEVLVEVNVGGEASKGGCEPGDLGAVMAALRSAPHLSPVGLMTIPPEVDEPDAARPFFAALRALRDAHGGPDALPELSMGMSHDFAAAIAEGATIVRIGTAIFGPRTLRAR